MNKHVNWIAFQTILIKEILRFVRIWPQTLLPPAITTALYFVIFGKIIGGKIGDMGGFSYIEYIAPGLIMLTVINNSYANVVSSFFGAKFQHYVEELQVSPVSNLLIISGYVAGGIARGVFVGIIVTIVTLFFTPISIQHFALTITVFLLTSAVFALAGFINAVFANSFDDISIVPTFILTPLTYLGGIFYSVTLLPPFWEKLSYFNPILYMVNGFRYSMLGISDIHIGWTLGLLSLLLVVLFAAANHLMNRGTGLKY
ncbi:ABC transporter permease [Wohlfahrtiimonas chitiniclastica]|uniref:ABC transporter permease n=1 Tax=Wohlfahrtiimonas chitiniclastica TaxID=400946 RepID=UPI000B986D5F|nr:ABC transporter permease [Wohlfahrtiimonas chitiniclastica]MBS7820447.1 ABC transporter permease [Wohlfahrtiimonas chitiniclastica]OYQ88631.1 ABC transporter permease [Wohlfahrtiimonas chitiniclastica]